MVKNSSYKCELRTTKVSSSPLRNKDYFYKSSCHSPSSHSNNSPSGSLLWLQVFCSLVVIVTPEERLQALRYKDVGSLSSRPAKDKQDFNGSAGINTFIILYHSHKTALGASLQTALVPCSRWNATQDFSNPSKGFLNGEILETIFGQ